MYVVVWHFQVAPGRTEAFERAYGPGGDWARFFTRSIEFQGTELLRAALEDALGDSVDALDNTQSTENATQNGRDYFTIDRWSSREAYLAFNERFGSEYEAMDRRFLELCNVEVCLGHFETVA